MPVFVLPFVSFMVVFPYITRGMCNFCAKDAARNVAFFIEPFGAGDQLTFHRSRRFPVVFLVLAGLLWSIVRLL